jgi:hypothetical protein
MDLELAVQRLESIFFTPLLLYISILAAFIIQIKHSREDIFNLHFRLLTIVALFVFFLSDFFFLFIESSAVSRIINQSINVSYSIVELTILLYYFEKLFRSNYFKYIRGISLFVILFLTLGFIWAILNKSDYHLYADKICNFELSILTLCCFKYFYTLLRNTENKDLLKLPSFWIVTGLFFYCIMSTPFFFIYNHLSQNLHVLYRTLFGIHYIFFSIFYIMIAKAYTCKTKLLN